MKQFSPTNARLRNSRLRIVSAGCNDKFSLDGTSLVEIMCNNITKHIDIILNSSRVLFRLPPLSSWYSVCYTGLYLPFHLFMIILDKILGVRLLSKAYNAAWYTPLQNLPIPHSEMIRFDAFDISFFSESDRL